MFDCIDNGFYFYPISHLIIPSILFLHYGKGGWSSVFFAFSLSSVWELVEYLTFELFDSYITFPDSSQSLELVCDVVLLDIGNGLLGCILAWAMVYSTGCEMALKPNYILTLAFLALYSPLSSFGWYCNKWLSSKCEVGELVNFPWGNVFCWVLTLIYSYTFIKKYASMNTAHFVVLNSTVLISIASFKVLSSAILTYIGFALLMVFYGGYFMLYGRKTRVVYEIV